MILTDTDLTILRASSEILREASERIADRLISRADDPTIMDAYSLGYASGDFAAARESLTNALITYDVRASKYDRPAVEVES